jgi:uncharacterized protein (DUF2225 family)
VIPGRRREKEKKAGKHNGKQNDDDDDNIGLYLSVAAEQEKEREREREREREKERERTGGIERAMQLGSRKRPEIMASERRRRPKQVTPIASRKKIYCLFKSPEHCIP